LFVTLIVKVISSPIFASLTLEDLVIAGSARSGFDDGGWVGAGPGVFVGRGVLVGPGVGVLVGGSAVSVSAMSGAAAIPVVPTDAPAIISKMAPIASRMYFGRPYFMERAP
jgi:hypothetical protein